MSDSIDNTPPWREIAPLLEDFDLARTPTSPGSYVMRDGKGKVIYVGKAKNLRSRVRSYLNESDSRYTVKFLMARVVSIEFLVTSNEKEAVLLENSLIKQYKPRYNVHLKDDKTYVSIKLNTRHAFPRLTITRKHTKDGSKYYGPHASAGAARQTIRQLQRNFPLRLCSDAVLNNRTRPCLYYQIGQCAAPCVGEIDKKAYRDIVEQVDLVLSGRDMDLERQLESQIKLHAERLEFEEAATLRDRLFAVRKTLQRQQTVEADKQDDRDVFGVYAHGRYREVHVMFYRAGKLVGGRSFSIAVGEMPLEEVFGSFLLQYYGDAPVVPDEAYIPVVIEEAEVLESILSERRGKRVRIVSPQRGAKRKLIELAEKNAEHHFEEKRLAERADRDLIEQTREKLGLARPPQRIECFDIATTQGEKSVGSMVVFEGGNPNKARYRRYAIKEVEGQDDFAMMREVLMRRYRRAVEEDDLPDLVLIDGGKGQLGIARAVLEDLGIEHIGLAGIAKSRTKGDTKSPERFFVPGRKNAIVLPQHSPVVLYLARVRDEAHRFANTYHAKRRGKAVVRTALTEIPGVGPGRARALLKFFGSVERIREANVADVAQVPGFSTQLASNVISFLTPTGAKEQRGSTE